MPRVDGAAVDLTVLSLVTEVTAASVALGSNHGYSSNGRLAIGLDDVLLDVFFLGQPESHPVLPVLGRPLAEDPRVVWLHLSVRHVEVQRASVDLAVDVARVGVVCAALAALGFESLWQRGAILWLTLHCAPW